MTAIIYFSYKLNLAIVMGVMTLNDTCTDHIIKSMGIIASQ